jgi:hypothetical protein
MVLNIEQKELLKQIVNDKFSVGAFSGMIFNTKITMPQVEVEDLVKTALNVRLKLMEMIE